MVACTQTVQYAGQAIAMVLADTQAHADAAALLVTATYTDKLTPILTINDARANPDRGMIIVNKSAMNTVNYYACLCLAGFFEFVIPPLVCGDTRNALQSSPIVIEVSSTKELVALVLCWVANFTCLCL